MLRTAGLCTTGETRYPKKERYAKIQISLKVCDSAGDGSLLTQAHEVTLKSWCFLAAFVTASPAIPG